MAKYKAILIDYDGCIAKADGYVSQAVKKSILAAQKKLVVSIATGRSSTGRVGTFISQLKLKGPHIVFGGAAILDGQQKKFLWESTIAPGKVKKILDILRQNKISFIVYEDKDKYLEVDPLIKYDKDSIYKTVKELPNKSVRRFNIRFDNAQDKVIYYQQFFAAEFPNLKVVRWGQYDASGLDITASSKIEAFHRYLELLKLRPKEVLMIGDGYNDLSLMMAVGFKVAMGNAVKEIKEIADYIAPSVDEDGVADVIEKYILN